MLAVVAGATSAFAVLHKQVTVDVDGSPCRSRRSAGPSPTCWPAAGSRSATGTSSLRRSTRPIASDGQIVVRHGRDVDVEVDGSRAQGLDHRAHGRRGGRRARAARRRDPAVGVALGRARPRHPAGLDAQDDPSRGRRAGDRRREQRRHRPRLAARTSASCSSEGDQVSVPLDATVGGRPRGPGDPREHQRRDRHGGRAVRLPGGRGPGVGQGHQGHRDQGQGGRPDHHVPARRWSAASSPAARRSRR